MSPANEFQIIPVIELLGNVLSKVISSASEALGPSGLVEGIAPEQVANGTVNGHLLDSVQGPYMIQSVNGNREPSMKTKDAIVDQSSQREIIKSVREESPYVRVPVLSAAFIIKPINLGNLSSFMVPSENGNPPGVPDLQGKKQRNSLDRIIPSVDVIAHEEEAHKGRPPSNGEELHQIMELSVDVSANSHWGLHRLHIPLFDQNLPCFLAKDPDLSLGKGLALKKGFNELIYLDISALKTHYK